ncbi:hypothetical protein [Sulfurimonas sp.]|uniref:hypothetical protein n=1 Tax=Sulfurimonas sp. TaxID=2022749 RepID=UPI0025E37793|nr:hypothetical protein [Sulfurimonas sp.]MBW6488441.1 hypothetical protein [Sulfurimonas sp.]
MKKILLGIVFISVSLFGNEIEISPKVGVSFVKINEIEENGEKIDMVGTIVNVGLDGIKDNFLVGMNFEILTNDEDRAISLHGIVYKNDILTSKYNCGLGVEVGRVGWDLLYDYVNYITPKVSFIYNRNLMLDIKKREDDFILTVSYSF